MKKAIFLVMILKIISKILGFTREMTLSYFYGASLLTDAYIVSQTIPSVIFGFIGIGITTSFIPMYSSILKKYGPVEANKFTNNTNNVLVVLTLITITIILLLTKPIVGLFASGFEGEALLATVKFARISAFAILFNAMVSVFSGYLRVQGNYLIPASLGIPLNIVTILSIIVSVRTNVFVLVIGSGLATASQLLLMIPFMHREGFRYKPILNFTDNNVKQLGIMALPVIIGGSLSRINILIDRTLASGIVIGGITALNYASQLEGFIQGLFVTSLTTVLYPMIARMVASNDIKGLKAAISEAISIISLLVIPATFGAILFSREIVVLLFGRGAFTFEAIEMTSTALFYYSIGMLPIGLRSILARSFYAHRDTKTPMVNAAIGVVINIILNIILSKYMGIGGLALATSISAIVTAVLMFITLRKKIGSFGLLEISRSFIKIVIASAIMGMFAFGGFKFFLLYFTQNLALIGAIIIGALVYGLIIFFMKIPEVDNTLAVLKKKMGNGIARFKNNNEG